MLMGQDFRQVQIVNRSAGLWDPLKSAMVIGELIENGAEMGFSFSLSSDFAEFGRQRQLLRNSSVSPMFDNTVSRELSDTGFWMSAHNRQGDIIGLQAFRLDYADPNLADWALGWMMGLYAKRRELIIPRQLHTPNHSMAALIQGKIVYHGELWIQKNNKGCFNVFPRLGMLLALLKWQPQAIWALSSEEMATRGRMVRMGYSHIERSFLTWEWEPHGAEAVEWLAIAERRHLEFAVAEMAVTEDRYQLLPAQ